MSQGKILVVRGGAIGDFILTLPALAALRKQFPRSHLEVLGYPQMASLAKLAGYVNEVRSIEARALAGFFARRGELDPVLAEHFGSFNIIVSYLYDPDEIFRENVARCSKAQFIAGPHRPDEMQDTHATEVFLKPLERLAIFSANPVPRIDVRSSGQRNAGGTLAVHPGSGGEKKNWPEEHWEALLRNIVANTDGRVLLVGGEAEEARLQRLSSIVPIERLTVAVHQPLTELAVRMAACHAFIGHDSGITHLAAAVGLRGLALWGGTKPDIWRPRSERFELLRDERGLNVLEPQMVFDAVIRMMNGPS
ncbi:MAG TPA: glycosyltransferase family 9 protein [Methylomirabilota bacterium]|nr:glycosyltransferase family 9 protein [Methylomirabilota bacterium]